VLDQCLADLAIGRDDVEHARWQPGFREDLSEEEAEQRRLLRRLEDDAAPGQQRRRELRERQREREVPRDDGADDPDGLAAHQQWSLDPLALLLPREGGRLRRVPVEETLEMGGWMVAIGSGEPTASVMVRVNSSARAAMSSPALTMMAARSWTVEAAHGPASNAARAARTARSMSARPASAARPIDSSVSGLITSTRRPSTGSSHSPPT